MLHKQPSDTMALSEKINNFYIYLHQKLIKLINIYKLFIQFDLQDKLYSKT
jgi:hypothetical protein